MNPRLHLETTIPSHLVARRSRDLRLAADQETTQEWWEAERHDYELFISQAVVTEVSQGDANFAAAHGMDLLLTWNCRHINNHHIRARIMRACAAFDLTMPDICTPAELMKQ